MEGKTNRTPTTGGLTNRRGFINSSVSQNVESLVDQKHRKARLALENGNYIEAVSLYKDAILFRPENPDLHFEKGLAHDCLGQTKEAVEEFQKTTEISPSYAKAWFNLGVLYYENVELTMSSKEVDPLEAELELLENLQSLIADPLEKAIEMFDKAIAANPKYEKAYFTKGYILADMGKLEESVKTYEKLIEVNPNNANYHFNAGTILYESSKKIEDRSKLERAVTHLSNAIKLNPNYKDALMNKACALCDLEQYQEARVVLDALLKKFPEEQSAKTLLQRMDEHGV